MTGGCARCKVGLQFEFPTMVDAAQTLPHAPGARSSSPVLALALASLFWSAISSQAAPCVARSILLR